MKNDRFHQIAISLRHTASTSSPHFTFITHRRKVISVGINQTWKTHPLANKYGHRFNTVHSELNAITNFQYPVSQLKRFSMINIRLTSTNELEMSRPCKHCIKMLREFDVNKVEYSTKNGFKTVYL